jgi:type II secretory pathway component GspD/PulD (secretin)
MRHHGLQYSRTYSSFGAGLPKTNERSARTTVRVKDGQTVIIGGLIQSERHEGSYRVPVLSSIPFVGSLFRSRNDLDKQTEFVIYITPYLVTDGADIASHFTSLWTPQDVSTEGAALTPATSATPAATAPPATPTVPSAP